MTKKELIKVIEALVDERESLEERIEYLESEHNNYVLSKKEEENIYDTYLNIPDILK